MLASGLREQVSRFIRRSGLSGYALVVRDRLADMFGASPGARQAVLIATGSLLSWLVNRNAACLALASCVASLASEGTEAVLYFVWRRRLSMEKAAKVETDRRSA